jgi:hypothetical protein
MRRRIAIYGHLALAHVKNRQPEAACATLAQSIHLALSEDYAMGLTRARGVRAGFDQTWATLDCVRDLDKQLIIPRQSRETLRPETPSRT